MSGRDLGAALREVLDSRTAKADAADGAKPAGVLIPLYIRDGAWHVLLNLRSEHVGEHKGEVGFPGGSLDAADADMRACALREAHEEMGIRPDDVTVLGELDTVLTRTGYLVWPTVATIPYPYPFKVSSREVAEVMQVPLHAVMDEASLRHESRLDSDGNIQRRVGFTHGPHLVYGATATILEQLLSLVREAVESGGATLTPEVP